MFFRRKKRRTLKRSVRFTQEEIESANALYADIMASGRYDDPKYLNTTLAGTFDRGGSDASSLVPEAKSETAIPTSMKAVRASAN